MDEQLRTIIRDAKNGAARKYRDRAKRLAAERPELFTPRRDDPNGITLAIADKVVLGKVFELEAGLSGDFVNDDSCPDVADAFRIAPLRARKQATKANAYKWHFYNLKVSDLVEMAEIIDVIQDHERACLLSARPAPDVNLWLTQKRRWHASERTDGREGGALVSVPGYWRFAELDKTKLPAGLTTRDPEKAVHWIATTLLKDVLKGASFVYQLSASYDVNADDVVSVHIWFRSVQLMNCREWHAVSKIISKAVEGWDAAIAVGTQICFTARPTFIGDNNEPVLDRLGHQRVGVWWGDRDDVDLGELLERVRREEAVRLERARETARLARQRSESLTDAAIIRAYVKRWGLIAPRLGDGDGGHGFDKPIFQMLCAAVECGETDRDRCPTYLSEYLARVIAARRFERREKGGKAPSAYLAIAELQRRFDDALKKVWGTGDDE